MIDHAQMLRSGDFLFMSDRDEIARRLDRMERALRTIATTPGGDPEAARLASVALEQYEGPAPSSLPTCAPVQQNDEWACPCGRRWGVDEDKPPCPGTGT